MGGAQLDDPPVTAAPRDLFRRLRALVGSRLIVNSGYVWGIYILGSLFGFLFWSLSSRLFPPAEVGVASSIISISQLLVGISSLGIGAGIVQYFKGEPDQYPILNSALLLTGLTAIPAAAIFLAGLSLWSPGLGLLRQILPMLNFLLLLVGSNHNLVLQMAFLSLVKSKFAFWQVLTLQVLRVSLLVTLVSIGQQSMVLSLTAATWIANALGVLLLTRCLPGFRLKLEIPRSVLGRLIPYSLSNGIGDLLYRIPALLLPVMVLETLAPEASAYAYIAWMLLSLLQAPGWSLAQTIFAEGAARPEDLERIVRKGLGLGLLVAAGLGGVFLWIGPYVLDLFGPGYRTGAASLLIWFAIGLPFSTASSIFFATFRVRRQLRSLVLVNLLAALVFILASFLTLERFGLVSLGVVWFGSTLLTACLSGWRYWRTTAGRNTTACLGTGSG